MFPKNKFTLQSKTSKDFSFCELKNPLEAHTPVIMASTQYSYSIFTLHKQNGIFKKLFFCEFQ